MTREALAKGPARGPGRGTWTPGCIPPLPHPRGKGLLLRAAEGVAFGASLPLGRRRDQEGLHRH